MSDSVSKLAVTVLSIFPEMFDALLHGITGRALKDKQLQLSVMNPRDYSSDKHRCVDDRPYGGGPGMVMMAQPLVKAITEAKQKMPDAKVVYLSPQGRRVNQTFLQQCNDNEYIFIAGRYEGIDQRIIDYHVDEQWSIGDYVLTGGELAAMVIIDSLIRLQPGVLGNETSALQDSFSGALLDCPHYTRPEVFEGQKVPSTLLSGDHKAIERWRHQQALGQTWLQRPDLLASYDLSRSEQVLLDEFIHEYKRNSHD